MSQAAEERPFHILSYLSVELHNHTGTNCHGAEEQEGTIFGCGRCHETCNLYAKDTGHGKCSEQASVDGCIAEYLRGLCWAHDHVPSQGSVRKHHCKTEEEWRPCQSRERKDHHCLQRCNSCEARLESNFVVDDTPQRSCQSIAKSTNRSDQGQV